MNKKGRERPIFKTFIS